MTQQDPNAGGKMVVVSDTGDFPALADDHLITLARTAEARIDAVVKIKRLALKVTNPRDWTDQGGNPYLQVSGAEKIANLFNISWGFLTPEPIFEQEPDGHYTYTFRGKFWMGGRSIEVEGSRSSKDPFFKEYTYGPNNVKTEKAVDERTNKRDVQMAALTNLLGNGITRLLGIRNLTWGDLEEFAGIKKEQVGKIEYKTAKPPQEKKDAGAGQENGGTGDGVTDLQVKKINALLGGLGYKKDDERHAVASSFLRRKIASMKDLTKAEAMQLIDYLVKASKDAQGGGEGGEG